MSREQNIAARALGGELEAAVEFDRLEEVFAADFVDHDPASGRAPGVGGIKQFWRGFKASGRLHGYPPDWERFEVRAFQVARFKEAMFVERWGGSDSLGLLSQLGIPMLDAASGGRGFGGSTRE